MPVQTSQHKPTTGLHILGEVHAKEVTFLVELLLAKKKVMEVVNRVGFNCVGVAEHVFPGGGYTLVVLLAESHIALHTWPESLYVTLDVFACNVSQDNTESTRELFESVCQLFAPHEVIRTEVIR